MYKSYRDITGRISEEPTWWLDGIPRYCEFKPELAADYQATEVLLVHVRCQSCKRDFHVALGDWRPYNQLSYVGLLNTQSELGVIGDPPNHSCDGAGNSMTAEEVAVLEFWRRFTIPNRGFADWYRIPELERSLEEPDSALEERHLEAWSRIRRFRSRPEGVVGKWTPAGNNGAQFDRLTLELGVPNRMPTPHIIRTPTTGKYIGTPTLNQQRRLAMLALTGRISAEEFAKLKDRPQTEYLTFEERSASSTPDWAAGLIEEVRSIDETIIENAIPGWREMSTQTREEHYFPLLDAQLFELAISGRITPEERRQVLDSVIRRRCGFTN